MNKLLALAVLIALSGLLFLGVFSFVHRPLVVGEIQATLDHKLAYARTIASPKIVILAGSNGRYSHRCAQFSAVLGRPCVNASIGVGIGLDFLLDQWRPLLQRGDVVYMPLEYSQYGFSADEMHAGLQNALLVHHQREYLWSLDAKRIAAAYGSFDLPFLIHGLAEMALHARGLRRRSSTDSLTPQGDESGHTAERGRAYAPFVRSMKAAPTVVPPASDAIRVIEAFLLAAQRDGITVVGGLPTVPASPPVADETIERLRVLFEAHGARLLVLPHRSQYAIACFFDTVYHLDEGCQIAHSAQVAHALADAALRPSIHDR